MDSPANTFNPNKRLKEEFVSNLTGTSMMELFLLITTLSMLLFLRSVYSSSKKEALSKKDDNVNAVVCKKNMGSYLATATLDVLCIVFPVILCLTILADWTYTNAVGMTLLVTFFILARRSGFSVSQEEGVRSLRTNISAYRVAMNFLTCICILAVDFKIFPRRYAKTETYGTGLMDIGVGSFIVANALVSRQARGIAKTNLRNAISSTCPLIVLGFARIFFTSSVDYQVHVGEYGVHWNFFFTLAGVAILTSIINLPPSYCGILGWFILVVYEVILLLGLNEYLLSNERGHDIISQNKEGIFSIFGYWGLYLVCVQLGNYLFFGKPGDAVLKTNDWARIRVWIICLLFWLLTVLLDRHVERVSRRMCNLAYVTVVLAMNLQVFAVLTLADYVPGYKVAALIEYFDRNLLGSFLLANMLTGMVNLSMDTLSVSPFVALAILVGYAYILSIAAAVAHFYEQQYSTAASVPRPDTSRENNNLSVAAQTGGGGGGRKKRRRRPKICKNKEEAENQRMTHTAVERNRRKQMNEHLSVLRSLMPESYVQRGDQASIIGGAIEFVKELEHILQSLEAQKFVLLQQQQGGTTSNTGGDGCDVGKTKVSSAEYVGTPFAQFFSYPQYTCCELPNKYTSKSKAAIEVTLIETHANVRILSRRRFRQLSKLVVAFQSLYISVLHLNVTTLDPLVLYSISAKVEEGCQLNSADDIAGEVHHMLRIIEEEAATLSCQA